MNDGCITAGQLTWIIFISMILGAFICSVVSLILSTKKTAPLPMPVSDLDIKK